ncbi:MAG: hypothetical protein ACE5KO_03550, partial [Candidatus Bathyarchaeia archaeon]
DWKDCKEFCLNVVLEMVNPGRLLFHVFSRYRASHSHNAASCLESGQTHRLVSSLADPARKKNSSADSISKCPVTHYKRQLPMLVLEGKESGVPIQTATEPVKFREIDRR